MNKPNSVSAKMIAQMEGMIARLSLSEEVKRNSELLNAAANKGATVMRHPGFTLTIEDIERAFQMPVWKPEKDTTR